MHGAKKKGARRWAPFRVTWLRCVPAGGAPAGRPADPCGGPLGGAGRGSPACGQLARLLESRGRAGDGLERRVEDAKRPLGDVTDHVLAARLDLDEVQALDGDVLRQLAIELDAHD